MPIEEPKKKKKQTLVRIVKELLKDSNQLLKEEIGITESEKRGLKFAESK